MRLAVLTYDFIENAPVGMPGEWPAEVREIGDEDPSPGDDWVLMTKGEFDAHLEEWREDYNTWLSAQTTAEMKLKPTVISAHEFGQSFLAECSAGYAVQGHEVAELRLIWARMAGVKSAVEVGDLNLALYELEAIAPDSTFLTADKLAEYRTKLRNYLGSVG